MLRVDLGGLNSYLDELGDAAEEGARPAAQAAAQVLYDDVMQNVSSIGRTTGNLANAIYQAYSSANSGPGYATYHVSWNAKKAPHAILVEFGHMQRYKSYVGKDGNWYTAVRQEMRGKPKPKRGASQSVKDAYYVPLPAPKQVAAKPFIRPAMSKAEAAYDAAEKVLLDYVIRPS
jgi:HK97 gp10 family phage protein